MDFYELRHFCGAWLFNDLELPAQDVAHQLGHEDGGGLVQRLYGHPNERLARERIEAEGRSQARRRRATFGAKAEPAEVITPSNDALCPLDVTHLRHLSQLGDTRHQCPSLRDTCEQVTGTGRHQGVVPDAWVDLIWAVGVRLRLGAAGLSWSCQASSRDRQ
jgi:hypothetical protein